MLRGLDPELCGHLEDNYIQAQLYGMRWARLLLGREFQCNDRGLLRLWDYMFACVLDYSMAHQVNIEEDAKDGVSSDTAISKTSHPLAEDSDDDAMWATTSAAMKAASRFGSSPLLEALGDFMLAMLLHVSKPALYYRIDNVRFVCLFASFIRFLCGCFIRFGQSCIMETRVPQ
jgi:hypothetical protein